MFLIRKKSAAICMFRTDQLTIDKGHFFTTTKGMAMLRGEKKIRIQSNSNKIDVERGEKRREDIEI